MIYKTITETLSRLQSTPELTIGVNRLFKVRKIADSDKINNASQAYVKLLQGWDKEVMCRVKEYRTLVLDSADRPTYLISFPILDTSADHSNIARLFDMIKQLPNAKKVIIGQNSPEKTVLPDREEEDIAKTFKMNGASLDIPVSRHLIMSHNALFAFAQARPKKRHATRHLVK
jgi:hypothetical protein